MVINFFKGRKKLKVGLALGGGGARGFAHLGVLKAFEEQGLKFDFVAGTSAGALVGAMYCAGMNTDEMIKIAKTVSFKDIRTSKIPLMPNKTDNLRQLLVNAIGDLEFSQLKLPFCAVAVDMITATEIHLTKGNVASSVVASCAVPGFFTPVEIDNYLLFDGGLLNTVPANVPKLFGCDVVIAVDINSTRGYGTESTKYFDLMAASIRIMMKSNALKGYLNSNVMIQPDLKRFKATKVEGIDDMIVEGYNAAIFKMNEIKQVMGIKTESLAKQKIFNKLNSKNKLIV
jgi:NTE family protein